MNLNKGGVFKHPNISEIGIVDGLVAYYPLNKDVRDYSKHKHHGTLKGATLVNGGFDGSGAFRFKNLSTSISIPDDIGYRDSVTVIAWFRSIGTPGETWHTVIGAQQLELSVNSGGWLRTGVYTDKRHKTNDGEGLTDGQTHQIAMTFGDGVKKSFIDGIQVGKVSGITGPLVSVFPHRTIGIYGQSSEYYVNGDVSQIKVFNRVLTPSEINLEYERISGNKMLRGKNIIYIQGQINEV